MRIYVIKIYYFLIKIKQRDSIGNQMGLNCILRFRPIKGKHRYTIRVATYIVVEMWKEERDGHSTAIANSATKRKQYRSIVAAAAAAGTKKCAHDNCSGIKCTIYPPQALFPTGAPASHPPAAHMKKLLHQSPPHPYLSLGSAIPIKFDSWVTISWGYGCCCCSPDQRQ